MIREEESVLSMRRQESTSDAHNLRLLFAPASTTGLSCEEICGDYEEVAATGAIHLRSW